MSGDTWISLAGVVLATVAIMGTGFWRLAIAVATIQRSIADHRTDLEKMINDKIGAVYRDIETDRRITADALTGVRQAVAGLEIKTLENFQGYVRRDSFHKFLDTISEARAAFEADIKERLSELQRKLDRLVERDNARAP